MTDLRITIVKCFKLKFKETEITEVQKFKKKSDLKTYKDRNESLSKGKNSHSDWTYNMNL